MVLDPCQPNPCGSNGTCRHTPRGSTLSFICDCGPEYSGRYCEKSKHLVIVLKIPLCCTHECEYSEEQWYWWLKIQDIFLNHHYKNKQIIIQSTVLNMERTNRKARQYTLDCLTLTKLYKLALFVTGLLSLHCFRTKLLLNEIAIQLYINTLYLHVIKSFVYIHTSKS